MSEEHSPGDITGDVADEFAAFTSAAWYCGTEGSDDEKLVDVTTKEVLDVSATPWSTG